MHELSSRIFAILLALQFYWAETTARCSDNLALVGWPVCAKPCYTICDKYCPSTLVDPSCPCRSTDYLREAYNCISRSCSDADTKSISTSAARTCARLGYNIPSIPSTSSTTADEKSNTKKGVPIGTVVGIAVGVGFGVLLGAVVIWYFVRRRKSRTTMSGVAPTGLPRDTSPISSPKGPDNSVQAMELHGFPANSGNTNSLPKEIEGNAPGNAPGWSRPHELA